MKITKTKSGFSVVIKGFKTTTVKTDLELLKFIRNYVPGKEIEILKIVEKFGHFNGSLRK